MSKQQEMTTEKLWTRNFILLLIASLGAGFLSSFLIPTMPIYAKNISGTVVWAGVVTGAFSAASVIFRPFSGMVCSRFGKKPLLIVGMAGMTLMCFLYPLAGGIIILVLLRALNGITFGLKSTVSGVAVANILPESRMAEGISLYGLYLPLSNAIGPAIGLALMGNADHAGFLRLFLVTGIIGVVSTLLCFLIKSTPEMDKDIHKGKNAQENSKISEKDLPPTFIGFEKGVLVPAIVLSLLYLGTGFNASFVSMFASEQGWGPCGMVFTANAVMVFLGRIIFSKLVGSWGYDKLVTMGTVIYAAGLFCVPFATGKVMLVFFGALMGAGAGLFPAALNAIILERCTIQRRGTAQAAYAGAMDIGFGGGSLLLSVVLHACGFRVAYIAGSMLALAGLAIYIIFLWGNRKLSIFQKQ